MSRTIKHAKILPFPFANSLQNGRLEALYEASFGKRSTLIMDYQELQFLDSPTLVDCKGRPCEQIQGHYLPRRLQFVDVHHLQWSGLFTKLDRIPVNHEVRYLYGMLHWRPPSEKNALYLLLHGATDESTRLMLSARQCVQEDREGSLEPVSFMRNWSPPPPLAAGLVPAPQKIWHRFGGDPITIHLGHRVFHKRLFIGGLDIQNGHRPDVNVVLNLGEKASTWSERDFHVADRWVCKGEGQAGMTVAEIIQEARWVINHLQAEKRVLVHCVAGFNRSVTICCAVLILLEGCPAEIALARVREHHPWALPDRHHWLGLRWLAQGIS